MITEADTCRKYVFPRLYSSGWSDDQIFEQKTFTDGRIVVTGEKCIRKKQKRADTLLKYRRDFSIVVVEAKAAYKNAADGLQQAKDYAEILGLKFAYSTNGKEIVEHDFITGKDTNLEKFPSPDELWMRLCKSEGIEPEITGRLLEPCNTLSGKTLRYYQEIAINRAIKAILQGKKKAGKYIFQPIRQSQRMSADLAYINNIPRISLILSLLMSVTEEARKMKATGVRYWNTLNQHSR